MTAALAVDGVSFAYGRTRVLYDVSLHVGRAEIVTVIGPNGAGKTTLLNVIARSHGLHHGRVMLGDVDTSRMRQAHVVKSGCVLVPEGRQVFSTLTVDDNLQLGGYTKRRQQKSLIEEVYGYFPRLLERRRQLAGTLSGGEQQMLAVGRAYMSSPAVMLLDEPSLGLSPQMTAQVMAVLGKLRQERGLTVLLVEQNAHAALALADRGYLLNGGRIVLEGTSEHMQKDPTIQRIYLGGAATDSPPDSTTASVLDHELKD